MRPRAVSSPAPCSLAVLVALAAQDGRPPSAKETSGLVDAYFRADGKTEAGFAEQRRILARLDELPDLTASEAKGWRRKLS